jgi:hypothetical protein
MQFTMIRTTFILNDTLYLKCFKYFGVIEPTIENKLSLNDFTKIMEAIVIKYHCELQDLDIIQLLICDKEDNILHDYSTLIKRNITKVIGYDDVPDYFEVI